MRGGKLQRRTTVRRRSSTASWVTPRRAAAAVAAFGVVLFGVWYAGPTWRVGNVRVVNNAAIPGEQIIGVSALQGEHYQFVDLAAAAQRVDDLPGVDAAQVTCSWWGRAECTIVVQPAQPLAVWESAEGAVWTDYDGKVQRATGALDARLRLRVESGTPPPLGADVEESLLRALREIAALSTAPAKLSWSQEFGLTYEEADGLRVRLGTAERAGAVREKMALARSLAATLDGRGIRPRIIDVRLLEAPFYSQ